MSIRSIASASIASALFAGAVFNTDPLADLGLSLDGAEAPVNVDADALAGAGAAAGEVSETANETGTEAETAEKKKRKHVAIAPLEFGTIDLIPENNKGFGAKKSKYNFEDIAAPVANAANASGFDYGFALVKPEDIASADYDEETFIRSVQSATTAANRKAKEAGTEERFVSRRQDVEGEFVGVLVIRVDGTIATETEDKAE